MDSRFKSGRTRLPHRRVLIVITSIVGGGAEAEAIALAQALHARRWEVAVMSLLDPGVAVEGLRDRGIQLSCLGMVRRVPDPRAIFRLASFIRDFQPDIVHSQMVHANLLARITRLVCRMPLLICTIQSIQERSDRGNGTKLKELAYRATDWLADVTTSVCEAGARRYVKIRACPPKKMLTIPNSVDLETFHPDARERIAVREQMGIEDGDFLWLTAARLAKQKNYFVLLEAFRALADHYPKSRLVIAGDGPLRTEMEQWLGRHGLLGRVQLVGHRKDVSELMRAADAFVLCSAWEGLPLALLEASASCLPVIATDAGGNSETLVDGQTGFLVPGGDPAALAGAMRNLMNMHLEDRLQLGEAGRSHVLKFSRNNIVSQWESLYCDLFAKSRSGIQATKARLSS